MKCGSFCKYSTGGRSLWWGFSKLILFFGWWFFCLRKISTVSRVSWVYQYCVNIIKLNEWSGRQIKFPRKVTMWSGRKFTLGAEVCIQILGLASLAVWLRSCHVLDFPHLLTLGIYASSCLCLWDHSDDEFYFYYQLG